MLCLGSVMIVWNLLVYDRLIMCVLVLCVCVYSVGMLLFCWNECGRL